MEHSLSYQARRALLQHVVPQYRESSPSQKRTLLDALDHLFEQPPIQEKVLGFILSYLRNDY